MDREYYESFEWFWDKATYSCRDYKTIEGFINWFIKEQNDDCCQKDIMLDSLVRYLEKEKK